MGNNLKYLLFKTVFGHRELTEICKTSDPDTFDGYLGQGVWFNDPMTYSKGKRPLHLAILRHGLKSFRRHNIGVYDNLNDAYKEYEKIVDDDYVCSADTYNDSFTPMEEGGFVNQYTVDGKFVKKWKVSELSKHYDMQFHTVIDKGIIFDNSIWSYSDNVKLQTSGILQFTTNGEFVNCFGDTASASELLDLDKNALTKAVYRKKLYSGFYFILYNEDIADKVIYNKKPIKQRLIPVYRYLKTGEYEMDFKNVTEGARGTRRTSINAIKKSIVNRVPIFGYYWSYKKADRIEDTWKD